jgi:DNA-binding transcriptional MerR regulator
MKIKYSIKEVAELFNITTNKIRFYEKKGLITAARDEKNNYRYYTEKDLIKLQYVRKATSFRGGMDSTSLSLINYHFVFCTRI